MKRLFLSKRVVNLQAGASQAMGEIPIKEKRMG